MKRFKLFLASSAELSQERKGIALMISRLNNRWTEEKDVYIELVIWEDLPHSFRGEDIQTYFNQEMLTCDMVLALFFKKVGQFTEEEFKLAYENLKKGNKPHFLLVYFKSGSVPIEEINEELLKIGKLKREIQEYKQVYGTFTSMDDLLLKLQHQLELTILQEQETSLEKSETGREEKARVDFENYKQHLWQRFRYLDFTGLNAILQKPLELEKVYVKLRARESLPGERFRTIAEFKRLVEEEAKKPGKKHVDFVTLFKKLHKQKQEENEALRMLILGHPGSGKTTLMKWVALQCLKPENKEFFSQFTPVFISLKYLGSDPDNTFRKKSIGNLIVDIFEKENISVDLFIGNQMKANRLLFLLDGLDEIGDEKIRREVIDWIQKQYIYQNSLIVTSRFSGLDKAKGLLFREEIRVFEIRNFEMNDVEETKEAIELNFAGKVIEILSGLEYKKKNDELIETFYLHYPLYKHGKKLVTRGWDLFYNAPHPFVQSVGASILNRADENTKAELISRMKQRIDYFEKQTREKKETLLYFFFQNNNNFILQNSGRRKLKDFNYALLKLKSMKIFLQYMLIRDIRNIIYIRYILDIRDIQDMQDIQHIRDIRVIREEYDKKYKSIFKKNQEEIIEWADLAIEKLHSMSNKQLLEYFPNTTPKELREFREGKAEGKRGDATAKLFFS